MKTHVTVTLPKIFFEDHAARELPTGDVVKRTKRTVTTKVDREAFDDLLSDARYCATEIDAGGEPLLLSLMRSARAAVKRLEAAELPDVPEHPFDRSKPGNGSIRLREGESIADPTSTKRRIHGPGSVMYRIWPDGGIDVRLLGDAHSR